MNSHFELNGAAWKGVKYCTNSWIIKHLKVVSSLFNSNSPLLSR